MKRFREESLETIDKNIKKTIPANTVKAKQAVWDQFSAFCADRKYVLDASTSNQALADILKDWTYNMKKLNGDDYKESVVKVMWNQTAKLVQEKYFKDFDRIFDTFKDPLFQSAREAKDAKRRVLQAVPEKRKTSAVALSDNDLKSMVDMWDEDTPEGLQKKLFLIISVELAWRGGEGCTATVYNFVKELNNDGTETGRIEYNPIFTKTTQGGGKKCADSKWLAENKENPDKCPVRLFKKLMSKRSSERITSERLFLTPSPNWDTRATSCWYKDSPVGKNTIGTWVKESAGKVGLDVKSKKITNHSSRATAVSTLAKSGVGEHEIIKITGHATAHSIKPYLQLDPTHHENILNKMRQNELPEVKNEASTSNTAVVKNAASTSNTVNTGKTCHNVYNNCIFHCNNLNMN